MLNILSARESVKRFDEQISASLTLAELHVPVLMSFIKKIKLLQNLMKLLANHIMV